MSSRGVPSWPPKLKWVAGRSLRKPPEGEAGTLLDVLCAKAPDWNICSVIVEHEDSTYTGVLAFDDAAFCQKIQQLLQRNCRRPMQHIGDLEVPDRP